MNNRVVASVLDRSRQVALQIHEILRGRIIALDLAPGTVLSRASLQLEFGVSQTPVRDALMRLQEEDLVEVYPQYATVVSRIDIANATQAHFLRLSLELEAVSRLTQTDAEHTAAALSSVLARQQAVANPETYNQFDELDREFHKVIYQRAGIVGLWNTMRRQSVHLDRLRRLNLPMPGKIEAVIRGHRDIVKAIASGKPEVATDILRQHLSGTLSMVDVMREKYPDYIKPEKPGGPA
jgi:DNA-binding GntR family transcriptional regulator